MANQWNNPVIIADKMLEFFDGLSQIAAVVNRDYEPTFQMSKESIGQTIYVEKPPRYVSQSGPVINTVQDINRGKVAVTINKWRTVPIKLTGLDLTFNARQFDAWAERELKPIVSPLVNDVELDLFNLYQEVYSFVGTPGTGPNSYSVMASAREKLSILNAPVEDRVCFLNPSGSRVLTTGLSSGFNPQTDIGRMVKEGTAFNIAGFEVYEANNVGIHTVGDYAGTPVVSGANQVGSSLVTSGWTANKKLNKGDVFTIANVFTVNPTSKRSMGILQDFVVTSNVQADGSGNMTIPISPSIITSGAFQTVTNSPANGAAITVKTGTANNSYPQNLAFWKKAIGLVTVPIKPPAGLKSVTRTYNGMSITLSTGADIYNFEQVWRADIAYGVICFYPEYCVRITG